jgi:hypothetical protein
MTSIGSSNPVLYQVNTRVYLSKLSRQLGRKATLDDFPDKELDEYVTKGFQWLWLLSVWSTGAKGRDISCSNPEWQKEFRHTLHDLTKEDIIGSGFAITTYHVNQDLGGDEALARFRKRARARGLKLMLDFVANHSAIDHPWVDQHPDYYIQGNKELLASQPLNYTRVGNGRGSKILAYGRDPIFPAGRIPCN